ncbi:MAG: SGNH/GDSL hydrolase family protein, partial [Solirubrobacteraceae bacterium]
LAWGPLYAQLMRDRGYTVNFNSAACGGATIENLSAQVNAVTKDTDLVLLTIGGNDVGFINIVLNCFVPGINDPARCRQQVESATKNVPGVQQRVLTQVDQLLSKLRPGAKFGVLSYPYLANPSKFVLKGLFNSYEAGTPVRALGDLGDQMIINTVNAVNAKAGYQEGTYIPTKDLFVGHEPDQDPNRSSATTWINEGGTAGSAAGIYHPNIYGYQAMAQAVLRAGGPSGDFGVSH